MLTVLFNRPEARNAMTFAMYEGLEEACARADADDSVRVMVLRGAGGRAFVAGTDISQFSTFTSGEDGIAYEERITRVVNRLEDVAVPTVAAIEGPAWAAVSRWPPPATCGWPPSPRASASRSPGPWATACR